MFYTYKLPNFISYLYPNAIFRAAAEKEGKPAVYLSFDDGPHPEITAWVLEELEKRQAKATFFCVGENLEKYPTVHQNTLALGHALGNHTEKHANAWSRPWAEYLEQILNCNDKLNSHLFRPPYGKIWPWQVNFLKERGFKTILWDILSGDFDQKRTAQDCINGVLSHVKPASIIVFHDSEKAWARLEKALPVILDNLEEKGFIFPKIE